jgi:hypothetical protein
MATLKRLLKIKPLHGYHLETQGRSVDLEAAATRNAQAASKNAGTKIQESVRSFRSLRSQAKTWTVERKRNIMRAKKTKEIYLGNLGASK